MLGIALLHSLSCCFCLFSHKFINIISGMNYFGLSCMPISCACAAQLLYLNTPNPVGYKTLILSVIL